MTAATKTKDREWKSHISAMIRLFAPFVSGILAMLLPLDSMRYVFANVLTQLCEYIAKYYDDQDTEGVGSYLVVPALSVSSVLPKGVENLDSLISLEFRALESYLESKMVQTTSQKLYTASGTFAEIAFQSQKHELLLFFDATSKRIVSASHSDAKPFLFHLQIKAIDGAEGKHKDRLNKPDCLEKVSGRISFASGSDEKKCTAVAPNTVLKAVLEHIVECAAAANVSGVKNHDDSALQVPSSALQLLKLPDVVKIRRINGGGGTNKLYTDVLTYMSTIRDSNFQSALEAQRGWWGSMYTFASVPKQPVSFPTAKFGTMTIAYIDEADLSQFAAIPIAGTAAGGSKEESNSSSDFLVIRSDCDLQCTMDFLNDLSERSQTGVSLWQKAQQRIISMRIADKKDGSSSSSNDGLSWMERKCVPVRTRENSTYTREVEDLVFAQLLAMQRRRFDYTRAGISTRATFLLKGPPGTGKSTIPMVVASMLGNVPLVSFSFAAIRTGAEFLQATSGLASMLSNSDIYVVSVDDLEKSAFFKGFLQSNDTATGGGSDQQQQQQQQQKQNQSSACDIAEFLNWIDGVNTGSGRILFVSVNDDTLLHEVDKATNGSLLRDGRLNPTVHVGPCDRHQFEGFFRYVFQQHLPDDFKIDYAKLTVAQLQRLTVVADCDAEQFLRLCQQRAEQ